MIYTVTLNPALDKTVQIPGFAVGQVNRIAALRTDPGGKGINVSKVLRSLGRQSVAMGLLAGGTGQRILSGLEEMGLVTDFLLIEGETRTNLKVIDPVHYTNTDINEPGTPVPAAALEQLRRRLLGRIVPRDIVVLSGSLPAGAPADTYARWITDCKAAGARVFLDADGAALSAGLAAAPTLVKPNDEELSRLMGRPLTTLPELTAAAHTLLERGVELVVVSLGAKGALYLTRAEAVYAEGLQVPVGSTVGAGDSVVAAMAAAFEDGLPLTEAARLSTAVGAANVMCSGTQPAEWETVEELVKRVVVRTISQ